MSQKFFKLIVPIALLVLGQMSSQALAGSRKNVLTQAELYKGENIFWTVTNSADFVTAEQNLDFDTMFALLAAQGIPQNPKWEIQLCLPPDYWINELVQIYGPNPPPNGPVMWYLGWGPICKLGPRIPFDTLWYSSD